MKNMEVIAAIAASIKGRLVVQGWCPESEGHGAQSHQTQRAGLPFDVKEEGSLKLRYT